MIELCNVEDRELKRAISYINSFKIQLEWIRAGDILCVERERLGRISPYICATLAIVVTHISLVIMTF